MTLQWTGGFYDQTAKHDSMTLNVKQVKKGNWHWSLSRPQYTVTTGGRLKSTGTKVTEGTAMCRKAAMNEVHAEAAMRDESLWGTRKRIGTRTR